MTALRVSLLLFSALAACDAATTNDYRGPPVATLRGTMTAKQGLTLSGPVRLSVLWFSVETAGPGSTLLGVRSDEVAYTGTFPQAYELRFDGPPPPQSLQTTDAGVVGASGVLVAYEDSNGDGQLTMAQGGLIDRVLGASSRAFLATRSLTPQYDSQYLLYLGELGSMPPAGATLGYTVQSVAYGDGGVQSSIRPVGEATMPLELTGEPELSLLSCADLYTSFLQGGSTALCGVAPLQGLKPSANVQLSNDAGFASVSFGMLANDGGIITPAAALDAGVTLNGVALQHSSVPGFFSLNESPNRTITETNTVRVEAAGFAPWEGSCTMPAAVTVTAPASVHPGDAVTVSWTDAAGGIVFANLGTQAAYSPATSVTAIAPTDAGTLFFSVTTSGPVFPVPAVRCSRAVTGRIAVVP